MFDADQESVLRLLDRVGVGYENDAFYLMHILFVFNV